MNASLNRAVLEFCETLRVHHGFSVGRSQAHDILRAADRLGIEERAHLKSAMRALCCSRGVRAALRSRALRAIGRERAQTLDDLGAAWGGGTRIGASLAAFVKHHRARLREDTFVIVASDGLDVGDVNERIAP